MPLRDEKARRLTQALLANVEDWEARLLVIAEHAIPVTGNKARALSLARDVAQVRASLLRMVDMSGDD